MHAHIINIINIYILGGLHMEKSHKSNRNRVLFVLCTLMLAVICISPFGLKPLNANAACSHSWQDEKILNQPTCSVSGSKMQYCSKCRSRRTVTIAKLQHIKSDDFKVVQEPTCVAAGKKL